MWNKITLNEGQIIVSLLCLSLLHEMFVLVCLLYIIYIVANNWFEYDYESELISVRILDRHTSKGRNEVERETTASIRNMIKRYISQFESILTDEKSIPWHMEHNIFIMWSINWIGLHNHGFNPWQVYHSPK